MDTNTLALYEVTFEQGDQRIIVDALAQNVDYAIARARETCQEQVEKSRGSNNAEWKKNARTAHVCAVMPDRVRVRRWEMRRQGTSRAFPRHTYKWVRVI